MARRRPIVIGRVNYESPFPNTVWHCDGFAKLIRWKIMHDTGRHGLPFSNGRLQTYHVFHAAEQDILAAPLFDSL